MDESQRFAMRDRAAAAEKAARQRAYGLIVQGATAEQAAEQYNRDLDQIRRSLLDELEGLSGGE